MSTQSERLLIKRLWNYHDAESVKTLMLQGVNPNTCSMEMEASVLALASTLPNAEIVKILLEHGADPDFGNTRGATPLHHANTVQAAKFLLEAKANYEAMDDDLMTPLHYSVIRGEPEITLLLLQWGAYPHALSREGVSPYALALSKGAEASQPFVDFEQSERAKVESDALLKKHQIRNTRSKRSSV